MKNRGRGVHKSQTNLKGTGAKSSVAPRQEMADGERMEEHLRLTQFSLEHASDRVFWMDPTGRIVYVNEAACRSLGCSREDLLSSSISDIDPNFSAESWRFAWEEVKAKASVTFETSHRTKDGRIFPVEVRSNYLQFGGKEYAFAFARDISERRQAAEALEREKAFTEAVIDSFPDVFFVIQETGRFLHWGRNPEKVLGYTNEETMAMESAVDIVAEEDRPLAAQGIQEAFSQGNTTVELRLLHRDNRKIPYLVRATRAVIGSQTYVVGFGLDITDRKVAEEALKESEARFRTTFETAGIGIALVNMHGRPIQSNPALEKIMGYTAAELSGMAFTDFTHPDDRELDRALYFDMMEGKRDKYEIEKRYVRKDGQLVWGLLTASLVRDLRRQPQYAVGMVQDVTARKQAEEALRQSETALREALLAAQMGVWNLTVETGIVAWDENLYRLAGRDNKVPAPSYQELSQIYTPASWERLKFAVEKAITNGTPYELDLEMLRPDGAKRFWISRGAAVRDASGRILGLRGTIQDITERKRTEEMQNWLASFPRLSPVLIVELNGTGGIEFINPAAEKLLPNLHQAGIQHPWLTGFPGLEEACKEQGTNTFEREVCVGENWYQQMVHYVSTLHRLRIYGFDITERKLVEAENARLAAIVNSSDDAIFSVTRKGLISTWNAGAERMYGYPAEDIKGEPLDILIPEDRREQMADDREKLHRGEALAQYEFEHLRKDRSRLQVLLTLSPIKDATGMVTAVSVISRDITERMQAEAKLKASEDKFRKAFMTGADSFHIAKLEDGEILEVNDSAQQVFGYTREEMIGKTAIELGLYTDPIGRRRMVSEVKARGFVKNMEMEGRKKNGELFYALLSVSLIHGEDEQLILGVVRDVTEKKRAEEALQEREARLKEAEKLAHLGSSCWDVATDATTWSDELYRIVGRDPHLPPPKHAELAAIYTPESCERLEIAVRQALATGAPYDLELEVVRPDGTKRQVHARGVAQRAPDGSIVRLQGTLQDITAHHRLEQQFRQAQKMEAVGRLAGGVAHDFNNLLTVINGYSEMALESAGPDDPERTYFSEIRKAGERAAGLTRQLLAFSRQQVLAPRVLDLNSVIANIEKMLRRLIGEDIDLTVVQGPALGQVRADPGQLEQIIMNLVVNARDAMPHGGRLVITTRNSELDKNDLEKIPSVVRGRYVMLAVSDTGIGMDAQTQAHIFEPFFTTKEQGKGTGLGLATVYGIVKQSGGYIWVYSVPGQGTTFKIYLPRVDEPNEPFLLSESDSRPLGGSETILLVEDEKELRTLAVRGLEARGYKVLESASTEDALQMGARHDGPIHLLLTDVVMPGMSGRKVAEHLAALRPSMKVLYMSGYTDDSVFRNGVLELGTAFIQKPFTPSSLARKVRDVLDEQKPA